MSTMPQGSLTGDVEAAFGVLAASQQDAPDELVGLLEELDATSLRHALVIVAGIATRALGAVDEESREEVGTALQRGIADFWAQHPEGI
jgi:hypothetical protein